MPLGMIYIHFEPYSAQMTGYKDDGMELIGAEMQSTNSIEAVHTTRKEISDALDAAVRTGRTSGCLFTNFFLSNLP